MERLISAERGNEEQVEWTEESSARISSAFSIKSARYSSHLYTGSKRILDIVLAVVGILVLIPLLLVIAVCIKLEDVGDIFYFREMIGLGGRRFTMLKFRTMISNADGYLEQHPELKLEYQKNMKLQRDPRITRTGRFLRRTYLDELPQLFNVLVGQMSFVGPRAIPQSELALYGEFAERRHSVKPGITGLWQISPHRYRSYEERIPLDTQYIDNRSFLLDVVILLKTLKAIMTQPGV